MYLDDHGLLQDEFAFFVFLALLKCMLLQGGRSRHDENARDEASVHAQILFQAVQLGGSSGKSPGPLSRLEQFWRPFLPIPNQQG